MLQGLQTALRAEGKLLTLSQLRKRFCGFEASWTWGFFYGLLRIVTDGTFIQPSYTTSVRTAITEPMFGCIKNEEGGTELLLGERIFRSQNPYTKLYVPSWVSDGCFRTFPPRWAMVERRRLNMYSSFASEPPAEFRTLQQKLVKDLAMSKNGILITESYQVAKIEEVGRVFQDANDWLNIALDHRTVGGYG